MAAFNDNKCPVCDLEETTSTYIGDLGRKLSIVCRRCGQFFTSDIVNAQFIRNELGDRRYLLSAVIRRRADKITEKSQFEDFVYITTTNLKDYLTTISAPQGISEAAENTILALGDKTKSFNEWLTLAPFFDYPLGVCKDTPEFLVVVNYLLRNNLVQHIEGYRAVDESHVVPFKIRLTDLGFDKLQELNQKRLKHSTVFVAMSFNPGNAELQDIYLNAIKKAIEENTTLKVVRADKEQFNDDINDFIISQIRQAAFLVADFTENKAGVYFEAGYALGQGIQVIHSCKDEKAHTEKLHFDTNHKNHIMWKDTEDFHRRLVDRIRATVPAQYIKN